MKKNRVDQRLWLRAAENGALEKITRMIEDGAHLEASDELGWTAAMFAISENHPKCLAALIDAGCDVEAVSLNQETPMLLASHFGRPECVDLLIKAGCGIDDRDKNGRSALDIAVEKGHEACASRLRQALAEREALSISSALPEAEARRKAPL